MGVNSLPKTVTRQRRDCDLNPGPTAPESSTLITRLPSHPLIACSRPISFVLCSCVYADFSYTVCCRMFKSRRYNCAVNARMTVAVCVFLSCAKCFPPECSSQRSFGIVWTHLLHRCVQVCQCIAWTLLILLSV